MLCKSTLSDGRVILHLVEKAHHGKYCAGQWKDIESLNFILNSLDHKFKFIEFEHENIEQVVESCKGEKATDIILYYSFWPELLQILRNELPGLKLYVRSVNAEGMQQWQRSEISLLPSYSNIRAIYGSLRVVWRDHLCRKYADAMLGISSWDNQNYWRRLPGKAKIFDIPYYSPWPYLRNSVLPKQWEDRRNQIVCLAGGRDPIGVAMLQGFSIMSDQLQANAEFNDWQFLLSPGVLNSEISVSISKNIERMCSLDEPWDLLCSVKVLAVLTPLGFGFKTTIIDALAAGCHVLVHPVLAKRLPEEVRELCIEYDLKGRVDYLRMYQQLNQQPAKQGINNVYKQQVREVFSNIFES